MNLVPRGDMNLSRIRKLGTGRMKKNLLSFKFQFQGRFGDVVGGHSLLQYSLDEKGDPSMNRAILPPGLLSDIEQP